MAIFKIGNMLQTIDRFALYVFPANATLDRHGDLVMGAGAALTFKKQWPALPRRLGKKLQLEESPREYGILEPTYLCQSEQRIAALQTKRHWRDPSDLELVKRGIDALWLWTYYDNVDVHLAYPGIGRGGLDEQVVRPLLERLPKNVTIWRLE